MTWQIRMLGRFEVISPESASPAFRSRKVGALLAFLALNRGKAVSNRTLEELLWPDSDGDRQAQSLRRGIADLRDAIETESSRGSLVQTDHGTTMLDPDAFETDLERFEAQLATPTADLDYDIKVASAIALYGGPLLAPMDDDWVYAYRRHYEELFCAGVDSLTRVLIQKGMGKEAVRIASSAIILAPMREEPYIASIRAYAATDNRSMALRQYEALEAMLDDQYGQTPSEEALTALDDPAVPYPAAVPSAMPDAVAGIAPADPEEHFYIVREADRQVDQSLEHGEAVTLVFGPRQVGKTSLLARSAAHLRQHGAKVVVTDFQALGKSEIERPPTLYRALIHGFATQLGLRYEPSWNEWIGPNSNLDAQIDALLRQAEGRIAWAMDEVDRLFGTEYADDFFGLVRSWHNRRALDPGGPWSRLSMIISYATEAHLFIKDLNQSPFNVGVRVNLRDFSEEEVAALATRYPPFVSRFAAEVFEITRGHPYLTRRAFAFLLGKKSIDELQNLASSDEGPFAEHLRRLSDAIRKDPETEGEVQRILSGQPLLDRNRLFRLWAAGLLSQPGEAEPQLRTPIYGPYLRAQFMESPATDPHSKS